MNVRGITIVATLIATIGLIGCSMGTGSTSSSDSSSSSTTSTTTTSTKLAATFTSPESGTTATFTLIEDSSKGLSRAVEETDLSGKLEDGDIVFNLSGVLTTGTDSSSFLVTASSSILKYQIQGTIADSAITAATVTVSIKSSGEWTVYTVDATPTTTTEISSSETETAATGLPSSMQGAWICPMYSYTHYAIFGSEASSASVIGSSTSLSYSGAPTFASSGNYTILTFVTDGVTTYRSYYYDSAAGMYWWNSSAVTPDNYTEASYYSASDADFKITQSYELVLGFTAYSMIGLQVKVVATVDVLDSQYADYADSISSAYSSVTPFEGDEYTLNLVEISEASDTSYDAIMVYPVNDENGVATANTTYCHYNIKIDGSNLVVTPYYDGTALSSMYSTTLSAALANESLYAAEATTLTPNS